MIRNTIFALSSGSTPSGVAIIRVSGPEVRFVLETMAGKVPNPRKAVFGNIKDWQGKDLLDKGIVVFFPGPNSFTGEDCCEFQVHGGLAVVNAILDNLGRLDCLRLAEPGEFSKRAFENGKLDLVEIEGLADLIGSQTEQQRRLAIEQSGGVLSSLYNSWRQRLLRSRALLEAVLDFSDEEDAPDDVNEEVRSVIVAIIAEVENYLDDQNHGEIVREGYRVVLLGPPNAGKSSLINALARRDVALVSSIAGTTRDVIEVSLDLAGYKVILSDTAGIRDDADEIESMGIDKAQNEALNAHLVIWLTPVDVPENVPDFLKGPDKPQVMTVHSKSDLLDGGSPCGISVSVNDKNGLNGLISALTDRMSQLGDGGYSGLLSRKRHRLLLENLVETLKKSLSIKDGEPELLCENLRLAGDIIGKITGKIDVEELYGVIFSEFCIGK